MLAALLALACSSSPESTSKPDGGAGAAGAAGAAGEGSAGMAGAAGSPSSGGTAGAAVGGAGGSAGAGGTGGSAGSGGTSGGGAGGMAGGGAGGTGGTAGAGGGPVQCPEACVANATFNWTVASGPPNPQGYGKAYSECPAGSTFDEGSTDLTALYCFDCSIAKPSHVAATGQYVCTADIGAPLGSCAIHFRCKATNWCVPLAKPCS